MEAVRRITMFGDTGCRIWPLPFPTQDCASPTEWPLAAISRRVAMEKPDVVVFTGDFLARALGSGRHGAALDPWNIARLTWAVLEELEHAKRRGAKIYCKHFLILFISSEAQTSRLAIAVTTKLEKRAAVRNLIKRRVREVFRHVRQDFVKPFDMVVIARRDVQSCEFPDVKRELIGAWRAEGLLPKEKRP